MGTLRAETVGEHSRLTPVNAGERNVQRSFNFGFLPAPVDAEPRVVAACTSAQDALNVSLMAKGRQFSAAWYAKRLGVSPAFLSYIRRGERPIPEWIIAPICALTGTNLLRQWMELQAALRVIRQKPSETDRIESIARELRAA